MKQYETLTISSRVIVVTVFFFIFDIYLSSSDHNSLSRDILTVGFTKAKKINKIKK